MTLEIVKEVDSRGRYNKDDKCEICRRDFHDKAYREYKNKIWSKRWICNICYNRLTKYGTTDSDKIKEIQNAYLDNQRLIRKKKRLSNKNIFCCKCGTNETYLDTRGYYQWYTCDCKNENCKGSICKKCYWKIYDKRPDSSHNIIKAMRDFRNNNLDKDSGPGKGYIGEEITCKSRKLENLNIKNDNFEYPIDHSLDPELGILNTKMAIYNSRIQTWDIDYNKENIIKNKTDHIIMHCINKYRTKVERTYIFPKKIITKISHITIYKNPLGNRGPGWYEQYRVDEKIYDDAYQEILESIDNDKILRK